MPKFKVKATNEQGVIIYRDVVASSKDEVRSELTKEGLFPVDISVEGGGLGFSLPTGKGGRVKGSEFAVFNQGFMSLLRAGLGVLPALESLVSKHKNIYFKKVVDSVAEEVKTGKSLAEAMEEHKDVFPSLYIATIKSGERTGDLVPALKGYVLYQRRMETIKKKVISAVAYPVAISGFSFLVLVFMFLYVVPTFVEIFKSSGIELPLISVIVMGFSYFLKSNFLYIAGVIVVTAFLFKGYINTDSGRLKMDRFKITMPSVGTTYHQYAVAKFARTLAMILRSGIPLIQALEMSKGVFDNSYLESGMVKVIQESSEGTSVTESLEKFDILPDMSLRMFDIGEKSANLEIILDDIALFNEETVDYELGLLTSLLEPILIVIMGIIIAVIVVALYVPIFMMGNVI